MPWAYFDTSALVKRYVQEPGRREVLALLRRHDCVTSALLPIEVRSALRRRVSERSLRAAAMERILEHFADDRAFWTLVEIRSEVLAGAETLVTLHPLRTLDAIHVASAQLFATRMRIPGMNFVTADARQAVAASALGMTIRNVAS